MKKFIQDNCFKILCSFIFVVLLLVGLCFTYKGRVAVYAPKEKKMISVQYAAQKEKIKNGSILVQEFESAEIIEHIKVYFFVENPNRKSPDTVIMQLIDRDMKEIVQEWKIHSQDITEEMQQFDINRMSQENTSGKYELKMKFVGEDEYSNIGIYKTSINQYNKGRLLLNEEEWKGDLSFAVYGGTNQFLNNMFIMLAVFLIVSGLIIFYVLYKKNLPIEKLFLILAFVLGISHMLVMPAYSTPDERVHFSTAYYYSNILMGEEAVDKDGNVLVRNEDLLLNVENIRPSLGTYALIWENFFKSSTDNLMVSYDTPPLSVPFWSYLPQTLGITVARILNMGNISLLFLGSFFALVSYMVCVYGAIKLIPFGKSAMLVMGLYPMTLETAGSYSYDVLVNGLSLLFIGYVFFLAYEKKGADKKDWIMLAIIMFFMAPIKVVYAMLAFLCLIIPRNGKKKFTVGVGCIIGSAFLSCVFFKITTIMILATTTASGWGVKNTYTISYILENVGQVGMVLYNTLREVTDAILAPLFGQRLGYWDIQIPYYICFGFIIVLIFSSIIVEDEKVHVKKWHKIFMLVLIFCMLAGITLAMMLDFTDVTDSAVRGIQGRYFVPFLPLVVFLFRNNRVITKRSIDSYIIMSMYMLNYFTIWRIFETVVVR